MLTEASLLIRCMGQVASVSFFFVAPLSPPPPHFGEQKKELFRHNERDSRGFCRITRSQYITCQKPGWEKRLYPSHMIVMKNELCLSTRDISSRRESRLSSRSLSFIMIISALVLRAVILLITNVGIICHCQCGIFPNLQESEIRGYKTDAFIMMTTIFS